MLSKKKPIEEIMEFTGLSEEEIGKLRDKERVEEDDSEK